MEYTIWYLEGHIESLSNNIKECKKRKKETWSPWEKDELKSKVIVDEAHIRDVREALKILKVNATP